MAAVAGIDWESELADVPVVAQAAPSIDWEKELADVPAQPADAGLWPPPGAMSAFSDPMAFKPEPRVVEFFQKQFSKPTRYQAGAQAETEQMLRDARKELGAAWFPNIYASSETGGARVAALVARTLGYDKYADSFNRYAAAYEAAAAEKDEEGLVPAIIKRGARGVFSTLPETVLAAQVAGPAGAIGQASITEANQAVTSGREAGLEGGELAAHAVRQGFIEGVPASLFQMAGLGGLESVASGRLAVAAGWKAGLKQAGISLAQELPEELITEVGHNVEQALSGVQPNALSAEQLQQTVADTTVQTLMTMGVVTSPNVVAAGMKGPQLPSEPATRPPAPTMPPSARDWARANPEAAAKLATQESPGRKLWTSLGLPEGTSIEQRKSFTEAVRQSPFQPEEKPNAQQVKEPGPLDGGRRPQSRVRQEGGGAPEGRPGVQPGGRGDRDIEGPAATAQEEVVGGPAVEPAPAGVKPGADLRAQHFWDNATGNARRKWLGEDFDQIAKTGWGDLTDAQKAKVKASLGIEPETPAPEPPPMGAPPTRPARSKTRPEVTAQAGVVYEEKSHTGIPSIDEYLASPTVHEGGKEALEYLWRSADPARTAREFFDHLINGTASKDRDVLQASAVLRNRTNDPNDLLNDATELASVVAGVDFRPQRKGYKGGQYHPPTTEGVPAGPKTPQQMTRAELDTAITRERLEYEAKVEAALGEANAAKWKKAQAVINDPQAAADRKQKAFDLLAKVERDFPDKARVLADLGGRGEYVQSLHEARQALARRPFNKRLAAPERPKISPFRYKELARRAAAGEAIERPDDVSPERWRAMIAQAGKQAAEGGTPPPPENRRPSKPFTKEPEPVTPAEPVVAAEPVAAESPDIAAQKAEIRARFDSLSELTTFAEFMGLTGGKPKKGKKPLVKKFPTEQELVNLIWQSEKQHRETLERKKQLLKFPKRPAEEAEDVSPPQTDAERDADFYRAKVIESLKRQKIQVTEGTIQEEAEKSQMPEGDDRTYWDVIQGKPKPIAAEVPKAAEPSRPAKPMTPEELNAAEKKMAAAEKAAKVKALRKKPTKKEEEEVAQANVDKVALEHEIDRTSLRRWATEMFAEEHQAAIDEYNAVVKQLFEMTGWNQATAGRIENKKQVGFNPFAKESKSADLEVRLSNEFGKSIEQLAHDFPQYFGNPGEYNQKAAEMLRGGYVESKPTDIDYLTKIAERAKKEGWREDQPSDDEMREGSVSDDPWAMEPEGEAAPAAGEVHAVPGIAGQADIFGGKLTPEHAAAEREASHQRELEAARQARAEIPKPLKGEALDQPELFQAEDQGNLFTNRKAGGTAAEQAERQAEEDRPNIAGAAMGLGGGKRKGERLRKDVIPDSIKAPISEVEERLAAAHGFHRKGFFAKTKEVAVSAFHKLTRVNEFLPNTTPFAPAHEFFRLLRAMPPAAQDESLRVVAAIVDPIGPKQLHLFERSAIIDNLLHSLDAGQPLRFGFKNREEVQTYKDKLDKLVEQVPEVKQAIATRKKIVKELVDQLVGAKLLPETVGNNTEAYFHQQVLSYLEDRQRSAGGAVPQKVKRSFQKKRVVGPEEFGPEYDYNTSYIEAETAWMTDARIELRKHELLQQLKGEYDTKPQLQRRAKADNFRNLVGGQDVVNRIEELRGQLRESWNSEDREESYARLQRKAWIKELSELDPTYYIRKRMAVNTTKLAETMNLDPPDMPTMADIAEWADKGDVNALAIFKAMQERETMMRDNLGKKYATWETYVNGDPTLDTWQAEPGNLFYPAFSVPEKVAEQLQRGILDEYNLTKDDLRKVLAIGGPRVEWVVPTELAKQLQASKKPEPGGLVSKAALEGMKMWKVWRLLMPKFFLAYNIRNATGDMDPVIAAAPGAMRAKYQGRAISELTDYFGGKSLVMSPEMRAARDLGVISAGMTAQEIPDIKTLAIFKRFAGAEGHWSELPAKVVADYFKAVRGVTEFRESIFRYSAFLYYRDTLKLGGEKFYGASNPEAVRALKKKLGLDVAAAKLSRDLLGDYQDITVAGDWLRRRLAPFWSWQEINIKRYPSLIRNAIQAGYYGKAGMHAAIGGTVMATALSLRIGAMYAAMAAWNWYRHPKEEEELGPFDRANTHITLGSNPDGSVVVFRNPGALGEFLEWFGINDLAPLLRKYTDGQITMGDVATEMVKTPMNKTVSSVRPDLKGSFEIAAGQSLFPDVTQPRTIDRGEAAASILGLQDELRWMKGLVLEKGDRVRPHFWQRLVFGVSDPRDNALSEMYDLRGAFNKQRGISEGGIFPISKYKNAKEAARNQDFDQFSEWRRAFLKENANYADAYQKFTQMLRSMDPIAAGLSDKDEEEFATKFLNSIQKKKLQVARDYSHELSDRLWVWWEAASRSEDTAEQKKEYAAEVMRQKIGQVKTLRGQFTPIKPGETTEHFEDRLRSWKARRGRATEQFDRNQ